MTGASLTWKIDVSSHVTIWVTICWNFHFTLRWPPDECKNSKVKQIKVSFPCNLVFERMILHRAPCLVWLQTKLYLRKCFEQQLVQVGPMQGNPDSKKSLLVKSGMRKILPCGIQNPENLCVRNKDSWVLDPESNLRIRNPANILDSESKFLWQEIQDSAPETQNPPKKLMRIHILHIIHSSRLVQVNCLLPHKWKVPTHHLKVWRHAYL